MADRIEERITRGRKPRRPLDEVIYEFITEKRLSLIYERNTSKIWDIVHVVGNRKEIGKSEITLALPYKYGKKILTHSKTVTLDKLVEVYKKGKITLMNGVPIQLPSDTIDETEYYRLIVIDVEIDYDEINGLDTITSISFILQSVSSQYNVILGLCEDNTYNLIITCIETRKNIINISLRKDFKPLDKVEHENMESHAVYNKTISTLKQVAKEFYTNVTNCKEK